MASILLSSPINSKKSNNNDKENNIIYQQKRAYIENQSQPPPPPPFQQSFIGQYRLKNKYNNSDLNMEDKKEDDNSNNKMVDECCEKDIQLQQILNENKEQFIPTTSILQDICDYTDSEDEEDNNEQEEDAQPEQDYHQQEEDSEDSDDSDDSDDSGDSDFIEESLMNDSLNNYYKQQQQHQQFNSINKKYYVDPNSYFYSSRQRYPDQPKQYHIYADTSLRMELIEILTVMKNNEREKTTVEDVFVHEIIL